MSRDVSYYVTDVDYTKSENKPVYDIIYDDFITELFSNDGYDAEEILKYKMENTLMREDYEYELFSFDVYIMDYDYFVNYTVDNILIKQIQDDVRSHPGKYILFKFF